MNNTSTIEVKNLEKSPLNARKTVSKTASEELKASILAHGLLQNLTVTDAGGGKYHVIAGARRLAALQSLIEDGNLPENHAVPCQIVTEEWAAEMSLAENTVREAMHPADEFEAFAVLAEGGQSAEQIAQRFGTDEKHVLQRLKLGRVAPELIKEYRAGKLKLESLMAFTITDDRKRQLKVYRSLEGWQKDNARHIRECLTDKMVKSDSKLAAFVGLKAYEKAGGHSRSDLFGKDRGEDPRAGQQDRSHLLPQGRHQEQPPQDQATAPAGRRPACHRAGGPPAVRDRQSRADRLPQGR
jgi:ParB family chromosome partitioning protein